MTQPSKLGSAILFLFGLPFLGMGLFAAFTFLRANGQSDAGRYGAAVFASAFAVIGAGLIFGAIYGYAKQKQQAQIEAANPSSPWLWRKDWAANRVESKNRTSAIGLWIAAILVNMFSVPVCLLVFPQWQRTHDPKLLLPAGFGAVGILVVAAAIRGTIRLERFGKTYFEMNSAPFSPGAHLAGSIHAQLNTDVPHGIDLTLSCVRRVVTGSGKERSTQQIPLWEGSRNISAGYLSRGPLDTIVPVDFALPGDALQTDEDNPSDRVLWILKAKADLPGVDYSDEFELPVFRTSSAAMPASGSSVFGIAADFATRQIFETSSSTEPEAAEPAQHRVLVSETPDGQEFYFPAARNIGRAVLISSLAIGCLIFSYFLTRVQSRLPVFAIVVVALLDFVLTIAAFHVAIATSRILVSSGKIRWQHAIFGIGRTRDVQISEIDSILPITGIQQSGSSGPLYSIRLKTKQGKSYTLADEIESRQEARWIVAQMEKRAGLRVDAHVEINNSFYGPPPQPGNSSPDSLSPMRKMTAANRRGNLTGTAIGMAMFAAWIGFVATTMVRNSATRKPRANTSTLRRTGTNQPIFVRTAAMKQASLEDLITWPPQRQAEELMARSAEHDPSALATFDHQADKWVGNIQLSDNLKQLEDRTRYSNDLRVRKAEANLELALDGWSKTSQSVDLLIQRAHTDKTYRPAALYFLGVLAGDGVEVEHAHAILLDYALNNTDAEARQWATEGLRFIGTDQALDELFDIFTHDSSYSVRDRAGCNISDCGIFAQKQRWRMVPRLIDLAADPTTNSQMKNWCFLALQEISGEHLPADASAWQKWYRAHGSEKRAQFEALDWWQVRGDS